MSMQPRVNPFGTWTSYATTLGGLAALGAAAPAGAQILYTDITDLTKNTFLDQVFFDLDRSGTAPYASLVPNTGYNSVAVPPSADFWLRGTGANEVQTALGRGGAQIAGYYVLKLSAGATIGASLPWQGGVTYFEFFGSDGGTGWNNSLAGGIEGYIGLRIPAGPGSWRYGWARINYNDAANQMTLKDFAIEMTANTPIAAGSTVSVIPEPHGLLLGALGLGGLALRRRFAAKLS